MLLLFVFFELLTRLRPCPAPGMIVALKALAFAKFLLTAVGIEARAGLPVMRQSPPQYGISRPPVTTKTGPANGFTAIKDPSVNSSPGVTGWPVAKASAKTAGSN